MKKDLFLTPTDIPLFFQTAPVALETENRGEMKLALQYVPEPNPGMKMT